MAILRHGKVFIIHKDNFALPFPFLFSFIAGNCARSYHHPVPLSWNLGTLTSWNPLGLLRPVTGLFYLYLTVQDAEYESNQFSNHHIDRTARFTCWDMRPALLIFLSLNKHDEAVHTILALLALLEGRESWYVTTRTTWVFDNKCLPTYTNIINMNEEEIEKITQWRGT